MLFGLASIVLDTGLEFSVWVLKSSVIYAYNGIYIWKYGEPDNTEKQLNKLILVEKENQYLLKDTLNRLRIQELEIERLKKTGGKIDENFNNEIKELEKYVFVEYSDSL